MKRIDFLATDGILLNGFLYKNKQSSKDIILAVHGMSSNCLNNRDEIIAQNALENNIDYFCFNNRGAELVKYIRKQIDDKQEKLLGGTTYEDVLEGYEDMVGAILKVKELGYENIYLLGHSLGCTKIVYTYHELQAEQEELLEHIKGIVLLSLIDIPTAIQVYLKDKFESYVRLALEKEEKNEIYDLMPKDSFIHPISVKTFLRYTKRNESINFASYKEGNELEILNEIEVPLFMRWGNKNEMIIQKAEDLVEFVNDRIHNAKKDIEYIDGADHGYTGKEEIVAKQIVTFIERNKE